MRLFKCCRYYRVSVQFSMQNKSSTKLWRHSTSTRLWEEFHLASRASGTVLVWRGLRSRAQILAHYPADMWLMTYMGTLVTARNKFQQTKLLQNKFAFKHSFRSQIKPSECNSGTRALLANMFCVWFLSCRKAELTIVYCEEWKTRHAPSGAPDHVKSTVPVCNV